MLENMAAGEATLGTANGDGTEAPAVVVRRFLELLEAGDVDDGVELLAADVRYENVGLPTVHGRERVRKLFHRMMALPGAGFEAYLHTVSTDGSTVMTERIDVLKAGPVVVQLWVCGRFDVEDGQIALWRDYFDYANLAVALARGLLGAVLPAFRARPPAKG